GPSEGPGRKGSGSGKLPEALTGDTRDKVAASLGMSGRSYDKAKAVVEAARDYPELSGLVEEMDQTGNIDPVYRKMKRERQRKENPPPPLVPATSSDRWRIDQADCLEWFAAQPADSLDLVFGSPPYGKARLYLENGEDKGIARDTESWVAWMV